jgi:hypothetical protein
LSNPSDLLTSENSEFCCESIETDVSLTFDSNVNVFDSTNEFERSINCENANKLASIYDADSMRIHVFRKLAVKSPSAIIETMETRVSLTFDSKVRVRDSTNEFERSIRCETANKLASRNDADLM